MKIKSPKRSAFGFDLIAGFLLIVIPVTAGIFTIFMDLWSIMRVDNNMKLLNYNISRNLANLSDKNAYNEDAIATLSKGLCPNGTVAKKTGGTLSDAADGIIFITLKSSYKTSVLGTKELISKITIPSYNDLNGTAIFECK